MLNLFKDILVSYIKNMHIYDSLQIDDFSALTYA